MHNSISFIFLRITRLITKDIDSIFDASFIKAWTTRDPLDNQIGYSDREARVGRGRMAINKVRGVRNVASCALYSLLCLILNREAAENIRRPDKAVSPTFFNT